MSDLTKHIKDIIYNNEEIRDKFFKSGIVYTSAHRFCFQCNTKLIITITVIDSDKNFTVEENGNTMLGHFICDKCADNYTRARESIENHISIDKL